jgi:hypothetical protein
VRMKGWADSKLDNPCPRKIKHLRTGDGNSGPSSLRADSIIGVEKTRPPGE